MLYLLVLLACVVITLPLELVLGVRVYRRPRRLLLTLAPVSAVFVGWDALAIHARQWSYHRLTGVRIGDLPLEELLFFLVIPTCAVLTLEAVRRTKPAWRMDDSADGDWGDGE